VKEPHRKRRQHPRELLGAGDRSKRWVAVVVFFVDRDARRDEEGALAPLAHGA
jgi:hypothetical protein